MDMRDGENHRVQTSTRFGELEALREVLARAPGLVAYWDTSLRLVFANDAFNRFFDMDKSEAIGLAASDILGTEVFSLNEPYIARTLAGEPQHFRREFMDRAGNRRYLELDYQPHRIGDEVVGFFAYASDETDDHERAEALERSTEIYRSIARSFPDGFVLIFDFELRFIAADGPALEIFGLVGEVMVGKTLFEVLPDRSRELEPRYRGALEGSTYHWDRVVNGHTIALVAAPVRAADDSVLGGVVVATDVTEQRRRDVLTGALRQLADATARGVSVAHIGKLACESLERLFEHSTVGLVRFRGGHHEVVATGALEIAAFSSRFLGAPEHREIIVGVEETGNPQLWSWAPEPVIRGAATSAEPRGTTAAVPIIFQGSTWGAIVISTGPRTAPVEMLATLDEFATALSVAISSSEAWSRLEYEATVDGLTGLSNRRSFDEHLEAAVADARRNGDALSLLLFDLDHFKEVNDTHGHLAGDLVLREVANAMLKSMRLNETLARLGGDEFAVILPRLGLTQARAVAIRLVSAVEAIHSSYGPIELSVGAATLVGGAVEASSLISMADQGLYKNKHRHRHPRVHRSNASLRAEHEN
jgi:diguanylate cyclase (GGDEF)-like protein/PAS domain S-box-containing protein